MVDLFFNAVYISMFCLTLLVVIGLPWVIAWLLWKEPHEDDFGTVILYILSTFGIIVEFLALADWIMK